VFVFFCDYFELIELAINSYNIKQTTFSIRIAFTRWRHPSEAAHIRLQLTTHLSTSKGRKA